MKDEPNPKNLQRLLTDVFQEGDYRNFRQELKGVCLQELRKRKTRRRQFQFAAAALFVLGVIGAGTFFSLNPSGSGASEGVSIVRSSPLESEQWVASRPGSLERISTPNSSSTNGEGSDLVVVIETEPNPEILQELSDEALLAQFEGRARGLVSLPDGSQHLWVQSDRASSSVSQIKDLWAPSAK